MGTTSSKVRNRWNAKHYDRISITIPKGWGDRLREFCVSKGGTVNGIVTERIKKELQEFKKEEGLV